MLLKRYDLTHLRRKPNRRFHVRRDANCPVVTHVRLKDVHGRVAVPGWLVNISEQGCLITSDYFPEKIEDIYLIIPGFGSKVMGTVRNQGEFTIHVEFATTLTSAIVDKVARLTPVQKP